MEHAADGWQIGVTGTRYGRAMRRRERDILQRAVHVIAEQAQAADALVDEAVASGSEAIVLNAKLLRLELLNVKADLERELGTLVLDCADCGRTAHWVAGLGIKPGHWAHREPAPHDAVVLPDSRHYAG